MFSFSACILLSCAKKTLPADRPFYETFNESGVPRYNDVRYWAAHPLKHDPSDSVPAELAINFIPDTLADVFFIHPTTFTDTKDTDWNARINDEALNIKTDNSTILYQASVFNASCKIYAPRYRQAHLKAFYTSKEASEKYFDLAYSDIKAAFEYYLEHYNNGRPIIIASHSQGTLHAGRLLKEFFEGKPLLKKLVCAYIIGLPVPDYYFNDIKPCHDSISTGCFVSWRTYKSGYEPEFVKSEKFKAVVINPLTWTNTEDFIPASFNKGGVLQNFDKIIDHVVSAQVHQNLLWTSKPDVFGKIFLTNKNYHIGDINLFYMNIRENVKTRISNYYINNKK
ncbi:MAG: DUF3089 domain-containing protein [Ferruginibacter sp.]